MSVLRLSLVLNTNHNIICPAQISYDGKSMTKETFIENVIKITLNKFQQKYGIKRKKMRIFLENGEELSSLSSYHNISEIDYIYEDCTIYISNGEIFSSTSMNKNHNLNEKEPEMLFIEQLEKSSVKHTVGHKGKHIKHIVGESHIKGVLMIAEDKPHKHSKCKEFNDVDNWENFEKDDPLKIIQTEISNIQQEQSNLSKSKRNKPIVVIRGKMDNIKQANNIINKYLGINDSSYENGMWINLQSGQDALCLKLAKRFGRTNGINQSWFFGDKRKLNQLTITTHVIKDKIPLKLTIPCLYLLGDKAAVNQALQTLERHKITYENASDEYCRLGNSSQNFPDECDKNEEDIIDVESFTFVD